MLSLRLLSALTARLNKDGWSYGVVLALPVAVAAYLFGLLIEGPSGQADMFDLYTYSTIAALLLVLEGLLLARKLSLTVVAYVVLAVTSCQFVAKLVVLLYLDPDPTHFHAELTETFFWLPVAYIMGSFLPVVRWGRALTLGFFALISGVALSYALPNALRGENLGVVYALVQLLLANTTLLVLGEVFIIVKDRMTLKSSRAEVLERLAYSDSLTELPNRLALVKTLADTLRADFYETVSVFFIDIDGFKAVNDSFGHAVGDDLLKLIAARLRTVGRREDFICRISGDEFLMIFPDLPSADDATALGKRIQRLLEQPFQVSARSICVSASIGVAVSPFDGDDSETLLRRADAAMYEVKKSGKNGVRRFQAASEPDPADRAALVQEFKQAVLSEAPGLSLVYQPIFNDVTGRIDKVEALLRWNSTTQGPVSPEDFISIAEEVGLIHKLGDWMLHTACRQAAAWRAQGATDVRVCVNVSAHQFVQPEFAAVVEQALQVSGLAPGGLELELTESVVIQAFERVRACMSTLRQRGVAVALDDFGTGYSSLSHLEDLAFDTIKLDRSFAQKLAAAPENGRYPTAVVRAVVEIAAVLGVQVVAEGIETQTQRDTFRALGCTLLQGFYLARPVPGAHIAVLLLERGGGPEPTVNVKTVEVDLIGSAPHSFN